MHQLMNKRPQEAKLANSANGVAQPRRMPLLVTSHAATSMSLSSMSDT